MDHLPLPLNPLAPRPLVPLLCDPHEDTPFFDYPQVHGRPDFLKTSHYEIIQALQQDHLEPFIQGWLYFSLLGEFGIEANINQGYVSTPDIQENGCDIACLDHAQLILNVAGEHCPMSSIWLSCMALLELLSEVCYNRTQVRHYSKYNIETLHGWCPFEIKTKLLPVINFSTRFYLHNLRKQGSHDDCTDMLCKRATITDDYQPKHVCNGCDLVGPDVKKITAALEAGHQPVLDHHLNITSGPYVAISHVWADGLGNHSNTLPQCQIDRIQSLVRSLQGRTFMFDTPITHNTLHLWIDTLCCPVDPHYKSISLKTMADVYRNAAYTLVIAADLETYAYNEIGPIEAACRIYTSRWSHRLWTMQEAGLPEKLLFLFKDGIHDLRDIWQAVDAKATSIPLALRPICRQLHGYFVSLRAWFRPDIWDTGTVSKISAIMEFTKRRVSSPADEAICLSALLHLDATTMEFIWLELAAMGQLSQSIIFSKLPRSPLRWAPASILGADSSFISDFGNDDDIKVCYNDGLVVPGKRQLIKINRPPEFSEAMCQRLHQPMDAVRILHDTDWYQIIDAFATGSPPTNNKPPGVLQGSPAVLSTAEEWHLLYDMNRVQPASRRALLAYEIGQQHSPLLQSSSLVNVVKMTPQWNLRYHCGNVYAQALSQTWLPRCLRRLRVCEQLALRPLHRRILHHIRLIIERHSFACFMVALEHAHAAGVTERLGIETLQFALFVAIPYTGSHATVRQEYEQPCYLA